MPKTNKDSEGLRSLRRSLDYHRSGLRDIGYMLIEDGAWEPGSWLYAVASATKLQALPTVFLTAFGNQMEEKLRSIEDRFIGVVSTPANIAALQKELTDHVANTITKNLKKTPRLFRLAVPLPMLRAVARAYPEPCFVESSQFSPRVKWTVTLLNVINHIAS
jgi:hypothetical protein